MRETTNPFDAAIVAIKNYYGISDTGPGYEYTAHPKAGEFISALRVLEAIGEAMGRYAALKAEAERDDPRAKCSPGPSTEDREAMERLDRCVGAAFRDRRSVVRMGDQAADAWRIRDNEALAHIRRRLGLEEK